MLLYGRPMPYNLPRISLSLDLLRSNSPTPVPHPLHRYQQHPPTHSGPPFFYSTPDRMASLCIPDPGYNRPPGNKEERET